MLGRSTHRTATARYIDSAGAGIHGDWLYRAALVLQALQVLFYAAVPRRCT
jgi:hypothetical protein